jgi:hypothetical protein
MRLSPRFAQLVGWKSPVPGIVLALAAAMGCSGRVLEPQLEPRENAGRFSVDAGSELPDAVAVEPPTWGGAQPTPGGGGGSVGMVALDLSITPGATVNKLTYSCTGPAAIPSGSVTFTQAAESVTFVVGGIPSGAGYSCSLTGLDLEGGTCAGTTPSFAVVSGTATRVRVDVTCTIPYGGPDMTPDAAPANDCPGIVSFTINPSVVRVGDAAQLSLVESAPTQGLALDGGRTASNVTWSALCTTPPCGAFVSDGDAGDSTATSFVCGPTAQTVTLTAEVREYRATTGADGSVSIALCSGPALTKVSQTVLCVAPCGCPP